MPDVSLKTIAAEYKSCLTAYLTESKNTNKTSKRLHEQIKEYETRILQCVLENVDDPALDRIHTREPADFGFFDLFQRIKSDMRDRKITILKHNDYDSQIQMIASLANDMNQGIDVTNAVTEMLPYDPEKQGDTRFLDEKIDALAEKYGMRHPIEKPMLIVTNTESLPYGYFEKLISRLNKDVPKRVHVILLYDTRRSIFPTSLITDQMPFSVHDVNS